LLIFIYIINGAFNNKNEKGSNIKNGLIAGGIVFIVEGSLNSYRKLFIRPNMAFWRASK